jgi:peptidylprolyl isomerase
VRLKPSIPALSAVVLVVALAGCTTTAPEPDATTSSTDVCAVDAGSASNAVTVTGDLGAEPTVTFDAGLAVGTTERTTVVEGTGDEISAGGTATVAYTLYDGTTGKKIDSYGYAAGEVVSFTASVTSVLPGIAKTIGCTTVGSRVVSVVAPADAFGDDGYEDLAIAGGDTLVFVMDILSLVPSRADGVDQPAQAGFPTVALAADGTPTITVPTTAAPSDLQVAVLKKGDGATVAADSTVTMQYVGVNYATGQVFDETWGGTGPTTVVLSQLVTGFGQALTGQTVGSQVLMVIPPSLAYGEATDESNDLAGQTLVFVVDILAVN